MSGMLRKEMETLFREDWSSTELFLLYKHQVNLLKNFLFISVNPQFHFLSSKIGKFKFYLTLTRSKTFCSFWQLCLGVRVLPRGKKNWGKTFIRATFSQRKLLVRVNIDYY